MKYLLTIFLFLSFNVFGQDKIGGLYGNLETDKVVTCYASKQVQAVDCANKVMFYKNFRLHSVVPSTYGITLFLTR